MRAILIIVIRLYQSIVSPYLGFRCRYVPTCSDYFKEAVKIHGSVKGFLKGMSRILRCHPFGGHGFDPVSHE